MRSTLPDSRSLMRTESPTWKGFSTLSRMPVNSASMTSRSAMPRIISEAPPVATRAVTSRWKTKAMIRQMPTKITSPETRLPISGGTSLAERRSSQPWMISRLTMRASISVLARQSAPTTHCVSVTSERPETKASGPVNSRSRTTSTTSAAMTIASRP